MRIVLHIGGRSSEGEKARWTVRQLLEPLGLRLGERPPGGDPFVLLSYGERTAPDGGTPIVGIPRHADSPEKGGRPGAPVDVYDREGTAAFAFGPFDSLPEGEALWRDRRGNVAACRLSGAPWEVRFAFDPIAPARFLLGRLEEEHAERDPLDRFRPEDSWLAEHDLFGEPLADRLGSMLLAAIEAALSGARLATARLLPWPGGARFAIALTHDQDQSVRWERRLARHGLQAIRGGGAGRRAGLRLVGRDLREGIVSPLHLSREVLRREERHGVRSTFFFLAVRSDRFDRRYDVASPPFRAFLRELASKGCAVGLHGGIESYLSAATLRREREIVAAAAGGEILGVRQHYARLRLPDTWLAQREAGLGYDASLGFPDTPGFRAGTGFPVAPEGIDDFLVFPFHGMDRALAAEGVTDHGAWDIWTAPLRRTGGLLDILWHPYYVDPDVGAQREALFRQLLSWIEGWKEEAWIATLDEAARWWRARSLVRVRRAFRREGRSVIIYRFGAPLSSLVFRVLPAGGDLRIEKVEGARAEPRGKGAGVRVTRAVAGAEVTLSAEPGRARRTA